MKKRLVKILWGMAVAALLLGGCGKKNEEQASDTLVGEETIEELELSEQEQQDIAALKEQFEEDREYNFAGIDESQLNVGDNAEDETDAEDTDEDAGEETASGKEKEPAKTDTTQTESGKKDNTSTVSTTKPSGSTTTSNTTNSTTNSGGTTTAGSSSSAGTGNAGSGNTTSSSSGSSSSGSTAHTHSYQTVSVAATCTTAGYTEERCSCGDVRNHKDIPAEGHYYEAKWFLQPTCVTDGYVNYVCSKCGAVDESRSGDGEKLPHTVAERVKTEGNCTQNKIIEQYCTVCGTVVGTREEPGADVHDWVTYQREYLDDDLNLQYVDETYCSRCHKMKE